MTFKEFTRYLAEAGTKAGDVMTFRVRGEVETAHEIEGNYCGIYYMPTSLDKSAYVDDVKYKDGNVEVTLQV